jgi:DNA primase
VEEKEQGEVSFEEIRRTVPLLAVLERYGLMGDLKRAGSALVGCCPIHRGTNRRQFTVSLNRTPQLWRCFSPEHLSGGGVLEFVSQYERIGLTEAARTIARWFAMAPGQPLLSQRKRKKRRGMSDGARPTHKVYSAQKREGQKDFLTRIGSAWPFSMKDGKTGLNIQLSAMPIGDRMVLFEYDAEEPEEEPVKKPNARRK